MTDPLRLKYHSIAFRLLPLQFNAGVTYAIIKIENGGVTIGEDGITPEADFKAEVSAESVNVLLDDGVMPPCESQSNVGSVLKSLTTVWKKATAYKTTRECECPQPTPVALPRHPLGYPTQDKKAPMCCNMCRACSTRAVLNLRMRSTLLPLACSPPKTVHSSH